MEEFEETEQHSHELVHLFDELSFIEKYKKVFHGLKEPKDSGEYKYAKLQLIRLLSPLSSVVIPAIIIATLVAFGKMTPPPRPPVEVQIIDPEPVEELKDIEEIIEEPLEPPDPIDVEFTPDVTISTENNDVPSPSTEVSAQPALVDSVAMVKSPVIMKGIIGNRNPGARGSALGSYGGSGKTEGAVLRALRWLKMNQNADGSWNNNRTAMTGLALLTFLAHGETPASEEFGSTVEKAIRWLIDHQGENGNCPKGALSAYPQAIATYAMCEAYALTKVPVLKEAAEKAVNVIIRGQTPTGGWCYALKPTTPNDTSVMGWCAQALKAAKMAGLENPGLKHAIKLAIKGFKGNASPQGGFGYRKPGAGGLTGVGVLCMQLLGAAKAPEVRRGLTLLEQATFNWSGEGKFNQNYYWYYITQSKFHAGGSTWKSWNKLFSPVLVRNQTIIPKAIMGPKGKMVDAGFWDMDEKLSGHSDGVVMNTCLCALQLQVYYRYLPTFKPPKEIDMEEDIASDDDIDIEISI